MKIYFKTLNQNNMIFYGYHIYMNNKLVDNLYGVILENKDNILNKITLNMLKRNKDVLKYDKLLTLKYDSLESTKNMVYAINHNSEYNEYHKNNICLMASPSIFLSDVEPSTKLLNNLKSYQQKYNYFNKHKDYVK